MNQIRSLLNLAQQSTGQVETDVSFKRPDRAYVEYLVSSELLLNVIPKHKDYPAVNSGGGDWQQIYKSLRKVSDRTLWSCVYPKAMWLSRELRVKS